MLAASVLLAALACAAAFSPLPSGPVPSTRLMSFEGELGAQAPLGFWDPLGILKNADQDRFDRLRYVELKHGRISMLAILGHIVTAKGDRLPGNIAFGVPYADMKAGLAAAQTIPVGGLVQLFFFIGLLELGFGSVQSDIESDCVQRMEGLGWDAATQARKAAIELNNGRAAQMGILALMVHEKLNNDPYVINALLGAPVPFNQ